MNNSVRFSCTALAGTGKQGILPRDANGYYTMPVGGLNVYNSAGQYYPYEGAKELFSSSGPFMRRIKTGCLKGEYGHPKPLPGQSDDAFANRVLTIEEKNTCVHFAEIFLDFDKVKDEMGKPVVAIMAKLAPAGPYGPALQKSLENAQEEVCFSIRAFTEDVFRGGVKQRNLREIVTWDFVTEPGISVARKYKAPALESMAEREFSRADLVKATAGSPVGLAMESASTGASLLAALGWEIDQRAIPKYLKW